VYDARQAQRNKKTAPESILVATVHACRFPTPARSLLAREVHVRSTRRRAHSLCERRIETMFPRKVAPLAACNPFFR
jgi:hypothetical protein